jgi:hypothetical protein
MAKCITGGERQGWNVFGMAVLGSWVGPAATRKNDFAGEARIYGGDPSYLWRRVKPTLLERTSGRWEPSIGGGAGGYVGTGRNACATGG